MHRPTEGFVDEPSNGGTINGLLVEQGLGHGGKAVSVKVEYFDGPSLLLAKDSFHLFVDDFTHVFGVVAAVHEIFAEEDLTL